MPFRRVPYKNLEIFRNHPDHCEGTILSRENASALCSLAIVEPPAYGTGAFGRDFRGVFAKKRKL
jgi:hypothetical protein